MERILLCAIHKRRKMAQGKEEKKTWIKNNKEENEKTCGSAELPKTAEEKENGKLESCSARLKANSTNVEQKQNSLRDEQSESDDINEIPKFFSLNVQRYDGETCEGQFHGEGVAYFEGGHMYKGMFSRGLMDGPGVFTRADGLKYEGEFVCNMPMGQGTYTWLDGSSYEGEVYNGTRHGTGTYTCAKNGVSYAGQWDQGKRQGKGAVYYNQDKTSWYKGDWVKNSREGWGVRCYPSGNLYSGEWKNNLRHGEGTMRWLNLGQQYAGMWQNGVQHGRGTHVWILKQADGSQYSQYTGDFVQGQRHGQGTFYFANGAIYEGEWSNNKSHAKGKFTSKDGRVFEGELTYDQMMTHNLNGKRAPIPLCDMALNIECLLDAIPERERDMEREQVDFVVLMHGAELRSIYSFYSRLGRVHSLHNVLLLTRLQLWRLLKDCNIHHHDITLAQIDRFIRGEATTAEIHSPFTPILLCRLLSCLAVVAYHIYRKDMASQKNLLASCFSRLMTDNILPNAKNIKGFLFRQPDCAVVAVRYLKKCWEVYQAYCKVNTAPRHDRTMTCRDLLWLFEGLHLLDNNLTAAKLLEIINVESCDPRNVSTCLDLEITFLEFFEVLLGSAEVKCPQVSEALEGGQTRSSLDSEARRNLPDVANSSDISELSTAQDVECQDVKSKVTGKPQTAEQTEEHRCDGKGMKTRGMKAKSQKLEAIHQFFDHVFFPAIEQCPEGSKA